MVMTYLAAAAHNVGQAPIAMMTIGVFLSASAMALAIFKPLPSAVSVNLQLPRAAALYTYYGALAGVAAFGLTEATVGFCLAAARDAQRRCCIARAFLWISIPALVIVVALGSLAFVN